MSENLNFKNLLRLKKKEIVKLLQKEGIEPNPKQSKEELIKLLSLAKKANEPTIKSGGRMYGRSRNWQPVILLFLTTFVFGALFSLYKFNPTFNKNVNFLVGLLEVENTNNSSIEPGKNDPTIIEKNGKTYVVYNHPLIDVSVLYDKNCKRPECKTEDYLDQVKSRISGLIDVKLVDVSDPEFNKIVEENGIDILPSFVFDKTVEKLGNFETIKENFSKSDSGSYILQFTPYKALSELNTDTSRKYLGNPETESIVNATAFLSFSSENSFQVLDTLQKINENYDNADVFIKYYIRKDVDRLAAKAAECGREQGLYNEMFNAIIADHKRLDTASSDRFRGLLNNYVSKSKVDYTDFFECYDTPNEGITETIESHIAESQRFGIIGAPALFVGKNPDKSNGIILGVYDDENFTKLIDDVINLETNINPVENEE